jgi:hypothetical protein
MGAGSCDLDSVGCPLQLVCNCVRAVKQHLRACFNLRGGGAKVSHTDCGSDMPDGPEGSPRALMLLMLLLLLPPPRPVKEVARISPPQRPPPPGPAMLGPPCLSVEASMRQVRRRGMTHTIWWGTGARAMPTARGALARRLALPIEARTPQARPRTKRALRSSDQADQPFARMLPVAWDLPGAAARASLGSEGGESEAAQRLRGSP